MPTKFFTNREDNTLFNKFKGILNNHPDLAWIDILVGYFRSSGYFKIRSFLENIPHIRILVGINSDSILARYNDQGLLFHGDDKAIIEEVIRSMKKDIAECDYSQEIEQGIIQFVKDVATGKIEIRAHSTRKLHAKIYIFRPQNWNEHNEGNVITGSSNLSDAGLGTSKVSNYEFNVLLNDYEDVKFATDEFELLWNEGVNILPSQLSQVQEESHLNDTITPFELYIKMLATYFGKGIEYNPDSVDLPSGYRKLSYQVDAVNQGFEKLSLYNGFFLSDVVGLGKTVVALMIAKKLFFSNGFPEHISRILIIAPPAVKSNWEKTVEDFGLKTCRIITNGSIHKEQRRFSSYDLVIVDEAHKFRNSSSEGYDELQRLCKSPAPQGGIVGKDPNKKKIMLISATPLNNAPSDIQSQVYLFQDGGNTALDVPNLNDFFKEINKRYQEVKHLDIPEQKKSVAEIYTSLRESIIAPLTIRRTRADLLQNESYQKDLAEQGITFPNVNAPEKLFYKLNADLDYLFDRTLECLAQDLNFSRYKAISYLKPKYKEKYKAADMASSQLQHIMKSLLVKRLDSSFYAFKQSLHKFRNAIDAMLKMLQDDHVFIMNKVNVTSFVLDEDIDTLMQIFESKRADDPTVSLYQTDCFESNFKDDLEHDLKFISELDDDWGMVDDDPKYDVFVKQVKKLLTDKKSNPSGKVVIFSEAEDTTRYLFDRLTKDGVSRVLSVYSSNRADWEDAIKKNFDANLKKDEQKNDYDVIICTEVLAEGINLHRAGVIINYDTPWNSTRLMQRVGRINRIGTKNENIYIYNFFPTAEVNDAIELEKRASMKLHAFHHALGSDSQIYSPDDEEPGSFGLFNPQATEVQDERLKILLWLRMFREENPEKFKRIIDLPCKIRCAKKSDIGVTPPVSSVVYLQNQRRDTFFLVNNDGSLQNISFFEAEKIVRCKADCPREQMPSEHYAQTVSAALNTKEKQSLAYLEAFTRQAFVNDNERKIISVAQEAIREQRFVNLYKEVNKIAKNKLRPIDNLPSLLKVIDKYINDIDAVPLEQEEVKVIESGGKPQIVISETLV